ncbi:MAG: cytochrome C [Ignavibacteriales bacterium]|nr:cytochrome C [Ignavibacteriales bacterium]
MIKNLLFLFLLFSSQKILAQISPGELSRAHSQFEGISNCTKCHDLGSKLSDTKCIGCHKEINFQVQNKLGFHSSKYVNGKNCWQCHGEHFGRNFQLIRFDEKKFDHSVTGFELTGKHSPLACKQCHQQKNISSSEIKNRKNTFLGLDQNCNSCHQDFHQNTLGNKCEFCHNTSTFKPAISFNHDRAKFKLLGAHAKVDCIKCHLKEKRNGKDYQKFTGLNFSNCSPCHQDAHKGKFGNDCKKCHVVSGFKFVNKGSFDHDKTNYPLIAKHKLVNCDKCHKGNISVKPVFDKCFRCHEDFHKGQFTVNNLQRDCSECHQLEGYSPSTFSLEKHNNLKFALEGKHKAIDCKSCHIKETKWQFILGDVKCINCHSNVHGNEISGTFMKDDNCISCHTVDGWKIINFNHSKTKFDLTGKHKEASCKKCHIKENNLGEIKYFFSSVKSYCEYCHNDVHFNQFRDGDKTLCERCHTSSGWIPVSFDHQSTKFPLEGAHSKVECRKCHKEILEQGHKFIKFKIDEFKCSDCHS